MNVETRTSVSIWYHDFLRPGAHGIKSRNTLFCFDMIPWFCAPWRTWHQKSKHALLFRYDTMILCALAHMASEVETRSSVSIWYHNSLRFSAHGIRSRNTHFCFDIIPYISSEEKGKGQVYIFFIIIPFFCIFQDRQAGRIYPQGRRLIFWMPVQWKQDGNVLNSVLPQGAVKVPHHSRWTA